MDTNARYTVVGLVVVSLILALVLGIVWLTVGLDRPQYHIYQVYMDQSVTGLNQEAPVKFNGVTVGYVKSMDLNPENPQEVIVDLEIKDGAPITTSTVATLAPQGITGIAFIALSAQTPNAPLLKPRANPPYPRIPSQPSLFVQISSLLKDASGQFQGMSHSVQTILDAENAENIKQILIHLNVATGELANSMGQLNDMVQSTQVILKNTAAASQNFTPLVNSLNQSAGNLSQASNMMKQGMLPTMDLISHLNDVSANLTGLTSTLKRNPSILVRGQQPLPLGPGE